MALAIGGRFRVRSQIRGLHARAMHLGATGLRNWQPLCIWARLGTKTCADPQGRGDVRRPPLGCTAISCRCAQDGAVHDVRWARIGRRACACTSERVTLLTWQAAFCQTSRSSAAGHEWARPAACSESFAGRETHLRDVAGGASPRQVARRSPRSPTPADLLPAPPLLASLWQAACKPRGRMSACRRWGCQVLSCDEKLANPGC